MSLTQSHFIFQGVRKGMFGSFLKAVILDVISTTSCKCVARFEMTRHKFPRTGSGGPRANQHGNMSCFGCSLTLVFTSQKSHITKHEPRNKNRETYHPSKHVKFWLATQCVFRCLGSSSLRNISH